MGGGGGGGVCGGGGEGGIFTKCGHLVLIWGNTSEKIVLPYLERNSEDRKSMPTIYM